jgi:hypothetical protein
VLSEDCPTHRNPIVSDGMAKTKSEEYLDALHTLRQVVLLECEDGHFHQVMLDASQYKRVSDIISKAVADKEGTLKPGYEMRSLHIKHGWEIPADTLLGLQDIYSKVDIAENDRLNKEETTDDE